VEIARFSCLLRKLGLCVARGGPRDLFLLGGHMLDSNYHVLAHMTHSLYLSPGLPGYTSLSLEHLDYHTLLQYNHIYIVTFMNNLNNLNNPLIH